MKTTKISKGDLIFANPTTKKGHESYVGWDDECNGWCFSYGQARSNLKFHSDINVAIADMKNSVCVTGKQKIKTGRFEVIVA